MPADAVLYTKSEVAGDEMGDAEVKLVNATLGIKTPLVLEVTSNWEEAAGDVVPIPTCDQEKLLIREKLKNAKSLQCFMVLQRMRFKIRESNVTFLEKYPKKL